MRNLNYDSNIVSCLHCRRLQNNKLTVIGASLFYDMDNLYEIDFSGNNISFIESDAFGKNPSLQYLSLHFNKIKTIEENSFVNLTNLIKVRLNNNEISVIKENAFVNLPRLKWLYLDNNNITVLDPKMTRSMPNLYYLSLDFNKIKTIEENSFVNLTNLNELRLPNNVISVIKENAFVNLPGLWYLHLNNNNITVLDPKMTRSMPNLGYLRLDFANIKTIEENTFANLTKLYELHLYNNEMSVIKENAFVNLPGLRYLYLSYNNITVLDPKMTRSMPYLHLLALEFNKIKTIEENSFVNLTNLFHLDLHNNEISVIKENAFVNLPGLQRLYLYDNGISSIKQNAFVNLRGLRNLTLQNNQLTVIRARLFYDMDNLYEIDFSGNNISYIESDAFGINPSLQYLYLTSNPLICNCSILPFWTWLTKRPSLGTSAICSNGTYVTNIASSALDKCNDTINGQWSNWGSWTECSMTCGNGTQYRNRSCHNPTPTNGGSDCQGLNYESVFCNNGTCPVNGQWSTWDSWTECNVTCGNGTQYRNRSCNNPTPANGGSDCQGLNYESLSCNNGTCSDTINGQWSNWGSWTACSLTCGNGTQYRNHYCNSPTPANGGSVCQGFSNESVVCNNGACPDTSNISSVTKSLQSLTTIDNYTVHDIVGLIKNLTYDPTILTSIDIITVADVLVNVSKVPSIDEKVLDGIFDIIDSVINVNISTLRNGQDKGSATNRLLEVVNAVSTSLDIGQKTGARFLRDNILMDVYDVSDMKSPVIGIQIDTGEFEALSNSTVKTITPEKEVKVNTSDAAIILPVELIRGTHKSTRVVLNVYRNWNLFAVRSDIKQYDPISRVVAASIIQDGRPVHSLGQYKVKALFYPRIERGNIICGYWDYDLHEKSGGWATDGCVLNGKEYGRYVCICDHLTNFAVLVNIGGQDTLVDSLALKTISYIGLILSIIGLSLTVLSFILLKHLRKGRGQQTLVNLAFSLLCFLIVFILGIEQTQDFYSCIAIAVLLHYFILVAFMWMLIEGILQYLRFVKVLGTYIPRFILKTAAPAWGVPLIPVIIVLALDHKLYHGGNKACWMSLSAFYYSFTVPVCVIVLANIIIFIMILKNLVGRPKGLTSNQSEKKRATMNLRAALSVLVLLGLTWIFGFFTIEGASVVFQYIFTILNVFQGFLIFVLFTAGDKQVRQGWKQLCCRQKQREKYLKTGTSSNENKSKIGTDNRNNNTELTEIDFSMNS